MNKYKELEVEVLFLKEQDVITSSPEGADDLGCWNDNWFSQGGN